MFLEYSNANISDKEQNNEESAKINVSTKAKKMSGNVLDKDLHMDEFQEKYSSRNVACEQKCSILLDQDEFDTNYHKKLDDLSNEVETSSISAGNQMILTNNDSLIDELTKKKYLESLSGSNRTLNKDTRRYSSSSHLSSISSSTKDASKNNKVAQLANFFDQIHFDALSKEFALQRELERLRLNKHKYKNAKSQNATPIVDIYKNVKDAIAEPLHDYEQQQINRSNDDTSSNISNNFKPKVNTIKNLENELEHSMTQWGEKIFKEKRQELKNSSLEENKGLEAVVSEPLPPVITDRKSTRLNSSHIPRSRIPSSA